MSAKRILQLFPVDWFYALNGEQSGPVSEARVDELLRFGTINHETLVWRAGMPDWQPLRVARPSAAPPPAPLAAPMEAPPLSGVCVECRRSFPQTDMVFLNKSWVCARCKHIYLQRIMEGTAPPTTTGLLWRSNRQMILRPESPLPDRCVRCNAPANGYRLKRQLYWHHPLYYLLILVSLLIYAIVALCIRKKALIHIGLCEKHRAQRKWFILGSWLAVLAGLVALIAGIAQSSGVMGLAGFFLLLSGAVFGAAKGPVVSAAKIDREFVRVKGVGQSFLADLPEWSGPS